MNFKRKKIIPGEKSYSDVASSKVYNTNNKDVFSDSIGGFSRDIRTNFNKGLINDRNRFK